MATAGGTPAALNFYEEYTYAIQSGDVTPRTGGGTVSNASGTLRVTRIGKVVTVFLDNFTFTTSGNVDGININGTSVPTRFLPAHDVFGPTLYIGNSGVNTGVAWTWLLPTATGILQITTRDTSGNNTIIANQTYTVSSGFTYTL